MDVTRRFADHVIQTMRNAIEEAGGNEVFFVGKINEDGMIVSVVVGARGNEDSVIVNENAARGGHVLIHNHPSGYLRPSEADQSIAYNASDTSMGFYIVNNDVTDVYPVVEPIKPRKLQYTNPDEAAFFLSKEGPLAKKNPNYEERPAQMELVKEITAAFNGNKIGVFEAGTGVGKSFAYLVPSILWAVNNKERVVISTGTINLQQQLFEKDIPAAQGITGKKIKAVLLKGRQNYVCLRRLSDAVDEPSLFDDDNELIGKINDWTKSTETGSRTDLTFNPPDSVWTRVNSESDACMGGRCPFRENCFVMKVRKEASDANLIVVNHHLLFADIESRMNGAGYEDTAVLPPYKRVVFDEAHGIEDSATSFFSESFTRFKLMKQVNLLYRQWKGTRAGFLVQAAAVSTAEDFSEMADSRVEAIREAVTLLDQDAVLLLENDFNVRIHGANAEAYDSIFDGIAKLHGAIAVFNDLVREVLEKIDDKDADIPAVWEAKTVLHRLEGYVVLCNDFVHWDEHGDKVFWMQKVRMPPKTPGEEATLFVQFYQTPLDIAPMMNKGVFEPLDSVVCTSATLRTENNFGYWLRRTGAGFVESERLAKNSFESPFPYKTNVLFGVPSDAPFPDSQYYQSYVEQTVPRLIEAAGGRTLVLFTSYDSLKYTYTAAASALVGKGITLFKQGDDDRFRLLENFKEDTQSVLFATDSFWEGVDVPGDSLSQVIIVKLPFAVPNDPVFAARSEDLEKKGGNPFMQLSVPQAVIKFRQGFGRLVRRGDDRGVIIVLDRRIVEKRYGKMFTTSVPMSRRMYNPLEQIISAVEKFF
ncbi:helicase C-terminal domain-containing protein [Treponema sp.]|uniref:helicase C-terminal domain-containing protein n=1 Tax=Treponema sp. TaxID=166 RepID=UPI00388EEAA6